VKDDFLAFPKQAGDGARERCFAKPSHRSLKRVIAEIFAKMNLLVLNQRLGLGLGQN